jgi:SulP family sulfate permease
MSEIVSIRHKSAFGSRVLAEFQPNRLVPGLAAGGVAGSTNVLVAISLAAMIFSDLSGFISNGVGLFLLGGIVAVIATGLLSSFPGTITGIQDAPAAILAVAAAAIINGMPPSAAPREKFMTVAAAVALTALLTGLCFILLGRFKLGALMRFLPYPVVGGFLAGTGWLLVTGGVGVMVDVSSSFSQLGTLFQVDTLMRWVPGLVLALLALVFLNRYDHFLILPGILLGATVLFYGIARLTGASVAHVSAQGWLLGPLPQGGLWPPIRLADLALVQWTAILGQAGNLASVMLISAVSLLLNASGIELVIKRDLDLNRELKAAGVGSLLAGLVGGTVNYHALTDTTLNYKTGRGSRLASWTIAGLCALVLFSGSKWLSFIPKLILGTLLIFLGLSFLYEWVYLARSRFPRAEYSIIWLILLVIAVAGYLPGVGVGILAAIGLFVVNYSRINVVKHALSGAEYHSRVTRSSHHQQALMEHEQELYTLQLQGFIFFGTANNLLECVRQRIRQANLLPVRFVVLDFDHVTGLDSTALLSFTKMKQAAQEHGITLLVTKPSPEIQRQLEKGGFTGQADGCALVFADLDHGLEWCENQILAQTGPPADGANQTLQERFQELLPGSTSLESLFQYLEQQPLEAGAYLMYQGNLPDCVYFVEAGQVTAQLERPDQLLVRLETMREGRVVGEIGFYLGQERTAAVVADEPSVVYRLSSDDLEQMEQQSPEAASAFHRIIIHLLAERASHLIRVVSALQR